MTETDGNPEERRCPVCKEKIYPHETALFFSGKGNLIQMRVDEKLVLIHRECAESFGSGSELLRFLTNGANDLKWLE